MNMNFEKRSNDLWEKIEATPELIDNTLTLAKRDLHTAKTVFESRDYDWSFAISYNAMLQAGRALMFSEGVRPKGEFKHVSVVEFCKKRFGKEFSEKVLFMMDKIRKKRHIAVYEQVNIVSTEEAENALRLATEFVHKVSSILKAEVIK